MDAANPVTPRSNPFAAVMYRQAPMAVAGVTLAAAYMVVWLIRWNYGGLEDDAMLYALQALARSHPNLGAHEIFLRYGSQDDYTIFTPVFAWLMNRIGLAPAGALLAATCHVASALATWFIARQLTTPQWAWLVTGIVLMVPGEYGALGVFQYA